MDLIDCVINIENGISADCLKVFSYSEPYFQGHFENNPVVPGTILIELMCQVINLVLNDKSIIISTIPLINFNRKVIPGDELFINVNIDYLADNKLVANTKLMVDGIIVCSGIFKLNR